MLWSVLGMNWVQILHIINVKSSKNRWKTKSRRRKPEQAISTRARTAVRIGAHDRASPHHGQPVVAIAPPNPFVS